MKVEIPSIVIRPFCIYRYIGLRVFDSDSSVVPARHEPIRLATNRRAKLYEIFLLELKHTLGVEKTSFNRLRPPWWWAQPKVPILYGGIAGRWWPAPPITDKGTK